MAFEALTSAEIAAGKPTKQELFSKTRENFNDHETRLATLEAQIATSPPIVFDLVGEYPKKGGSQTAVLEYRVPYNMTLTGARLHIWSAGSAGTTEFDILYKRGAGSFTSIFSTRPSVGYAAGDDAISTNAVFAETALLAGDILRLDVTSVQTGASGASLNLENERAV